MEDNHGTWLDQADLVFVDPIGTGYSCATLPAAIANCVRTARFFGGHMPYTDKVARLAMKDTMRNFIARTLSGATSQP